MTARARELPAAVVAVWCALWLVVGVWTAYEMWQLAGLSDTVADTGRTLGEAGQALQSLGSVPVVGDTTERLGTAVRADAQEIITSAGNAGEAVRRLSVLLGVTIALVPTVPVVVAQRRLASPAVPASGR